MKLIVVGGTGYVGRSVVRLATEAGHHVLMLVRSRDDALARFGAQAGIEERGVIVRFGADALINVAGRAHRRDDSARLDEANRQLPLTLAQHAIDGDIGRFVHLSSVGVYGNWSSEPITELTLPSPDTPYARSKLDGDEGLEAGFRTRPDGLTIVRPPMVYGPSCPGNFGRLRRLVARGLPLPFGAARARRSFVFVDNLADFLLACATWPSPGGMFVIADGSDYSVSELIADMAGSRRVGDLPVPPALLRVLGLLAGMRRDLDSLTRPMLVDWTRARMAIGWSPPVSRTDAMRMALAD